MTIQLASHTFIYFLVLNHPPSIFHICNFVIFQGVFSSLKMRVVNDLWQLCKIKDTLIDDHTTNYYNILLSAIPCNDTIACFP